MISIKKYHESDAPALAAIFYNTIHTINRRDYTAEQINAWAPEAKLNPESWIKKWEKLAPIVATIEEIPVGFAELEPCGHIDCFYVHHEYQGLGVGALLMEAIFDNAAKENIKRLYAEVSITAKPFFEKQGFQVTKEQMVTIRGLALKNFVMEFNPSSRTSCN